MIIIAISPMFLINNRTRLTKCSARNKTNVVEDKDSA